MVLRISQAPVGRRGREDEAGPRMHWRTDGRPLCPQVDLPGAPLCGCICKKNGKLSVNGHPDRLLYCENRTIRRGGQSMSEHTADHSHLKHSKEKKTLYRPDKVANTCGVR